MIAFVSCSTANTETIDEKSALDSQTRGEASQNDSSQKGGVTATIEGRGVVTADGDATEDPKEEVKNDSIPSDSTKSEQAFKIK